MEWEVGGRLKREGTQVYPGLIDVDVPRKATQSYKAIILQLKTETFKFFKNFTLLQISSLKKLERPLTPAEKNIITKRLISVLPVTAYGVTRDTWLSPTGKGRTAIR